MPNDGKEIQIEARDDEIIVDLDDLAGIQEVLDSSAGWERIEKCPRIGLALIKVGDPGRIPAGYTDPDAVLALDRLISYVKKAFADQHYGREPDIGKNRLAGSIEGSPYTGGGFSGPYTGGGKGGPYTGGGKGGPYTGGDQGDPQWDDPRGGFPERSHPPNPQVQVGILDTRLFAHPDLAGRYFADHDALVPATTVSTPDSEAHATFIAGVVLARAPNVDLVVGHVLNAYNICGSSWDVATKMAAFADARVPVLNISFGAATHDDEPPLVLRKTVQALTGSGVVIVAAAGNHGAQEKKIWPAAFNEVVAVGAGARIPGKDEFTVAEFSPRQPWVDLLAPGVDIRSLYKASGYATWDGTSFSAAGVSGAIAHLVETRHMTPAEAIGLLRTPPSSRERAAADSSIHDIGPAR
jgi:Subtilase family